MSNQPQPYKEVLKWIETQNQRMVDTVISWAQINSGTYHVAGVDKVREAVAEAFKPLADEAHRLPIAPLETVDSRGEVQQIPLAEGLLIRKRPDAPVKVLLSGHLDTVFPADSTFQTCKWIDDKTLNGPGVSDMKGGLVVMLVALEALERSPLAEKIGWEVLLTPDEEIGSQGSNPHLVEAAKRNQVGLLYEPALLADGTLSGARKGSGNFSLVVTGRATHAGRDFENGRNAVALLAEMVTALFALNGQREGVTLNPAKLEGGGPSNIVPDKAILRFNVRMPTLEDQSWLQEKFDTILAEFSRREGFTVHLYGAFTRAPKPMSPENLRLFELVKECGAALGQEIQWKPSGGCCDGNNLWAAGLANVDTLGVRGGRIHSDEEFLLVESLVERAKLSALILLKLAERG